MRWRRNTGSCSRSPETPGGSYTGCRKLTKSTSPSSRAPTETGEGRGAGRCGPTMTTRIRGDTLMNIVAETVVQTRYGAVRGSVADGIHIFKGIPYAAPPFGANRLLPPQPV